MVVPIVSACNHCRQAACLSFKALAMQSAVAPPLLRQHTACDSTLAAPHRGSLTRACHARRRGATHVKYTLADKARIDNLRELVEGVQDGVFRLTITPKCDWVTDTLNYTFTVGGLHNQAGLV